jgi:NADH-quinone oxidoreductase subunit N
VTPDLTAIADNKASFAYVVPEILIVLGICGLFIADIFLRKLGDRRREIHTWVSFGVVAAALVALLLGPGGQPVSLFNGLMVNDGFAWFFRLFALVTTLVVIPMVPASGQVTTPRTAEFFALMLSITLGLMLLPGATDLLMIFLALELISLVSYALVAYRQGVRISAEGALKYVIFGGVASGTMLFGFSLLYGISGGTDLATIHQAVAGLTGEITLAEAFGDPAAIKITLAVAVVFVLVGFGYKIAAAPFHMWTPDAYEGAPTPFTAFLSVGPKAAGLALMIRFFYGLFGEPGPITAGPVAMVSDLPWPTILAVVAIATMTVGNLTALNQNNLKRMLAFSSIAHAGYMLMGLAAGSAEGLQAVIVYAIIYLFMNLGAFAVVTAISAKIGGENVDDYRGLASRSPLSATTLAIFLFSLTGLPPLAGFIGKFLLFYAVISTGGTLMWILAVAGGLNGAVSLYYYARVVKAMFLDKAYDESPVRVRASTGVLAVAMAVPNLILGVWWGPAVDASKRVLQDPLILLNPPRLTDVAAEAPPPDGVDTEAVAAARR